MAAGSEERAFPVVNKQTSVNIGGLSLDIIYSDYGNRMFILISECTLQKMGTLMLVSRGSTGKEVDATTTFSVKTLLGKDEPEVLVYGRAIGHALLSSDTTNSSLLVAMGILNPDPTIIPSLLKHIKKLQCM